MIHQVKLTIFADATVSAEPDPVLIQPGDSVQWDIHFEDGHQSGPEGPGVEIRFINPASGPFRVLEEEPGMIRGLDAHHFSYHVFLTGQKEPLPWWSGRAFGGVDVGSGRPSSPQPPSSQS